MKKVLLSAVGLASALAASVASAAVMQLSPVYIGSTTQNLSIPPTETGNSATGLQKFTQFTTDGSLRHWFRVDLGFQGAAGEDFKSVVFDVNTSAGAAKINRNGSLTSTIPGKWGGNNPSDSDTGSPVFNSNADGGVANDLNAVNVAIATDPTVAQFFQIGEAGGKGQTDIGFPANLGYFQLQLLPNAGVPSGTETVSLTMTGAATGANNVSYYTGNQSGTGTVFTTGAAAFQGGSFTFPVGSVPEPTMLGLAATGLAVFGVRRRRA